MTSSSLPIFALPYPLILLPASHLTISVPKDVEVSFLNLIDQADTKTLPVVAVVPIVANTPTTLAEWGTAARLVRVVQRSAKSSHHASQPSLVVLHGLSRVRVLNGKNKSADLTHSGSLNLLPVLPIEYAPTEKVPSLEAVNKFRQSALRMLDQLGKDDSLSQRSKHEGYAKIAEMVEEMTAAKIPWLVDILVASINVDHSDKLAILCTPDSDARLHLASQIFLKVASIYEVSKKIATAVDESLSNQQKEFFLRQQMAAIQRELDALQRFNNAGAGVKAGRNAGWNANKSAGIGNELNDDEQNDTDDLVELKQKIEAMEPDSEERKMCVREWRRLKRIPAGSVENGVIRTYLDWLTSLPWPNSTSFNSASSDASAHYKSKSFLKAARAQLDVDHFGLEKIKKRLIEYLAVVRLKEMNAEREMEEDRRRIEWEMADERAKANGKESVLDETSRDQQQQRNASVLPTAPTLRHRSGKKGVKGPILLFVGPPGTGKTSLGQSIAKTLNRPFQRIALGGVRDEAEIRGHRRTYVASGPGLIIQALRKAGRADVVILLDEVDKVGHSNFLGDPAAALLEALDPEQNHTFNDHYVNVPFDLSQVLFICTANTLETISAALLDRCEVIQLSGYTYDEKLHIARRFLLPKQLAANGLTLEHVQITEPAFLGIATRYTREAGVRGLERAVGAVVRFKAVEWAEWADANGMQNVEALDSNVKEPQLESYGSEPKPYKSVVEEYELEKILGIAKWDDTEERNREERRGVVYGLVVMGQGEGGILPVETMAVPGTGQLRLTGSLGDVIKESGELALSWVKTYAYELCITNMRSDDPLKAPKPIDIHLHLPAGAQKKDGPSAGITMICALVSLLTGACVPSSVALTGEITLRGRIRPVGGVKEKVLGAHRAQISTVILPFANRREVEHEVPSEVRREMVFVFVRNVKEALDAAFGKGVLAWREGAREMVVESRL